MANTTYPEMLTYFKSQAESASPQAGLFAVATALLWVGYSLDRIADAMAIDGDPEEVEEHIDDMGAPV